MSYEAYKVVALCGLAGSGKSTAAEFLVERFGYHRVKFADPIKDMLRALGLSDRHIEGDLKEVPCELLMGRTPRYAMQRLGTEWGRELMGPDFWVTAWKIRAQKYIDMGTKVVVDDCRFPNELRAVKELGGVSMMIHRPCTAPVETHISEQHILDADYELMNDRALGEFKAVVGKLAHREL